VWRREVMWISLVMIGYTLGAGLFVVLGELRDWLEERARQRRRRAEGLE